MRKFTGYIAIVVTLLLTVLFSFNVQSESLNYGLEYDDGYEAVYRVDFEESSKTIDDIVEIFKNRLEDAAVRNGNIESVVADGGEEYQIRVSANSQTEEDFEYILRSLEATGEITVSTVLNEGEYSQIVDPFVRGSAKVEWTGSTPYVSVDVKNYDEFNSFIDACNEAYKEFNDKYNPDSEEANSIEGIVVIWLDKTDSDSYLEAFENENEVIQEEVKNKILSIIPTSYFKVEKDLNDNVTKASILVDRYDFDQIQMVGESAHTIERLLNYEPQDYSVDCLYVQKINPTYGVNAYNNLLIGLVVSLVIISAIMIIRYRLPGVSGAATLFINALLSLVVFNFFSYPVTTMVIVGAIISIGINLVLIVPILETFKDELLKGKNPSKASQEAFKTTRIFSLDILICSLLMSVITTLVSINQVKLFPITITICTIVSYVFVRILMSLMMWWLTSSKVSENPKVFNVNPKDIPVVSKDEVQTKFNFMNKFDTQKHAKKSLIFALISSIVSIVAIVSLSLIPSIGTFNYTSEFNSTTRIEITVEVSGNEFVFDTREEVVDFFEKEFELTPASISINKVENVIIDSSDRDDLPTIAYISIGFDKIVEIDYTQLETKFFALEEVEGENVNLFVATTNSTMPNYILMYSIVTLLTFGLIAPIYYLIRYKYSFGIASLSTAIPAGLLVVALTSISRISTSPLLLMGIAGGLFLGVLFQIPLFAKIKKLTRESKVKVRTFDQRREICLRANKESLHIVVKCAIISSLVIVIMTFALPIDLITVSIGSLFALILVTLSSVYLLSPIYLMVEKAAYQAHLNRLGKVKEKKETKGKKRLQKIKEAHKKVGSEPEESIIPGIND